MAVTQRLVLQRPNPALPGEWVCAGCGAPITVPAGFEQDPAPGTEREPMPAAVMAHGDGCTEVGVPGAAER